MKYLYVLIFLVSAKYASAQKPAIRLSTAYPQQGQRITITYQGADEPVKGRTMHLCALFSCGKYPYSGRVSKYFTLYADGKSWKGDLSIPKKASSLCILLFNGPMINWNWQMIYNSLIYKNKQPVENSHLRVFENIRMSDAKTKMITDTLNEIDAQAKEYEWYPASDENEPDNNWRPQNLTREIIDKKINEFKTSDNEKLMRMAAGLMRGQDKIKQADSLLVEVKSKFPRGFTSRQAEMDTFYRTFDPVKQEAMLNAFMTKYPNRPVVEKLWMRTQLMRTLIRTNNNRYKIQASFLTPEDLAKNLNEIAVEWASHDYNLMRDEQLAKQAIAIIRKLIAKSKTEDEINYYGNIYLKYTDAYAYVLRKQNKFEQAKLYMDTLHRYNNSPYAKYDENYVQTLISLGDKVKALEIAFKGVKAGICRPINLRGLEDTYIKVNGSNANYEADVEEADSLYYLNRPSYRKHNLWMAKKEMIGEKQVINKPAPAFRLKSLAGKTVSLNDFKGKTILVLFGSMWCAETPQTLKDLQHTAELYKKDKKVVFLYVETFGSSDNELKALKEQISINGYTFTSLVDEKASGSRFPQMARSFGTDEVPGWFVIDQFGRIRYRMDGNDRNFDFAMTTAIELTRDLAGEKRTLVFDL